MAALDESACIYAALILADDGVSITSEKLNTILKAANVVNVEPFWPVLFAKALSSVNIKDLIAGLSAGGLGAAPAAAAAAPAKGAAPAAPAKKEEKKKEPEPEPEEEEMSLSLFD